MADSCDQDQLDEIEALSSIYADEFKVEDISILETGDIEWINQSEQGMKINRVTSMIVYPQPDDSEQVHVGVRLYYGMVENYPAQSAALLSLSPMKGLSSSQIDELKTMSANIAQENIGSPAMYLIVDSLKEWLQANNIPGQDGSMYSDMMRRMQQQEVQRKAIAEKAAIFAAADAEVKAKSEAIDEAELERIRKRQAGTAVTVESFMAWKKKFEEEMNALKATARTNEGNNGELEKLSGKQWFLAQQAAGKDINISAEEDELIDAGEREEITNEEYDDDEEDDEDYIPSDGEYNDDGDEEDPNIPPPAPVKNNRK